MRIFQHKMMEAEVLGSKICNNIRDAMMAWHNIKSTQENRVLCRVWGVPFPRLRSSVLVVNSFFFSLEDRCLVV